MSDIETTEDSNAFRPLTQLFEKFVGFYFRDGVDVGSAPPIADHEVVGDQVILTMRCSALGAATDQHRTIYNHVVDLMAEACAEAGINSVKKDDMKLKIIVDRHSHHNLNEAYEYAQVKFIQESLSEALVTAFASLTRRGVDPSPQLLRAGVEAFTSNSRLLNPAGPGQAG